MDMVHVIVLNGWFCDEVSYNPFTAEIGDPSKPSSPAQQLLKIGHSAEDTELNTSEKPE